MQAGVLKMSFEDAKKDLAEGIINLILEKSNTIRYLIDNKEKGETTEEPVAEVSVAEAPVEEAPVAVQDIPGVMVDEQPTLEGVKTDTLPNVEGSLYKSVELNLESRKFKFLGAKDKQFNIETLFGLVLTHRKDDGYGV